MATLTWHSIDQRSVCIGYSYEGNSMYTELTDYSLFLSFERRLSSLTVTNEIRYVASFLEYLRNKRRLALSVNDELIEKWRDNEFEKVSANPISRGKERTNKRTVNAKLRRVYQFLWWYQGRKSHISGLIGPHACRVTSSENPDYVARHMSNYMNEKRWRPDSRWIFPLCFPRVGAGSKHRVVRIPTAAKIEEIRAGLQSKSLGFAEQRNLLMFAIAEETGLRRAAINSLRFEQFSELILERFDGESISIIPDVQKFSYDSPTQFSMKLCFLILNFVEQTLKPYYERMGWTLAKGKGKLFVSERTGLPLACSSLTRIFSLVFRQAGFEKGASVHLMRHYFTNVEIVRETNRRMEAGLDTSIMSICASVSLKLNHLNLESIQPYVSARISDLAKELEKR